MLSSYVFNYLHVVSPPPLAEPPAARTDPIWDDRARERGPWELWKFQIVELMCTLTGYR